MSLWVTSMVSIRSSERVSSPGASFTTRKLTTVNNRTKTAISTSLINHFLMAQEMSRSLVIIWNSNSLPGVAQPVTVFLLALVS